jgi:hypothetical protein
MCTPAILAERFPSSTNDTPTSARHVIIARAELHERQPLKPGNYVSADSRGYRRIVPDADCQLSQRDFCCLARPRAVGLGVL